ncbi:MAG: DoxX family membrane protein [Chloroflexi bacterium]|nr:DoxX family membrane protein [Chloroflexota bacterium]
MAVKTTQEGFGEPRIAQLIFNSPQSAIFWLLVRIYVGWQWLTAGWDKLTGVEPGWVGPNAGTSMAGFVAGALKNTTGDHPSVQGWYGGFLTTFVQPATAAWSYAITFGEILVGLGLIFGLFTGIAAFFGGLMNANYLMAGAVSTNPALFILATWLVLAWRAAGLIGLDRWALPLVGVPGEPGKLTLRVERAVRLRTAAP